MDHKPRADAVPGAQIDGRVRCRGICRDVSPTNEAPEGLVDEDAPTYEGRHAGYPMTTKKFPGQLPTDCGPLPRLLYSVDEVATMFGKAPSTIRAACWEHGLPYRLETTWGPGGRRFRRMVFSMREISALLDHYAPPVNQVLDAAAARRPRAASYDARDTDVRR